MIGQHLGNYRIEEQIGAGGMGVVYRATDTKLGRQVAIKILSPDSMRNGARRSRFEREARLLAWLNHPRIGSIYGIEECGDAWCLVLEYVPGPTLADRLAFGPLPCADAADICAQIADALETAHARGILHRDLKPGNVKITPDGFVKVLDFGLGKTVEDPSAEGSGDRAETLTAAPSESGIVLGTAAYMSPEQARGKAVDKRTDVWSFGCVLYEALTGRRAFHGETTSDTVALILERDPDWSAVPATVPGNVRTLVRRCLQKDARCRLRDLGDARLELEETLAGNPTSQDAVRPRRRAYWPAAAALVLLLAAAAGSWAWTQSRHTASNSVVRFVHQLPPGQRIPPSWNPSLMFSPDGKTLAFSASMNGSWASFQRPIDELDQKPLEGLPSLTNTVFSPDGQFAAMIDAGTLEKIAIGGNAAVALAKFDMYGRGDWGADGYIYYTERFPGGIVRVPGNGGNKEAVTTLDERKQEFAHRHAQILPRGKAIMFTVVSAGMESYNDARVEVQTLATGQRKTVVQGGFGARYSPSGHIVYANGGSLYAVRFDSETLEVSGLPAKVVDGAQMSIDTGATYFDVSRTGTLAYVPGLAQGGERTLVWVDRAGREAPLPLPPHSYLCPRISPDGKTLAVEIEGATHNLYTYDFARDVLTKITTDGASHGPVWTADGANLCFRSWKAGSMTMWEMPWDRSRPEQRLTPGRAQSPVSVSPDGRFLAFNQGSPGTGMDVWVMPLTGEDRTPRPFVRSNFADGSAKFSPDGKWVTYCSNESGKAQAYVQPWPGPGPVTQISSEGGTDPLWSHTGGEIFYRDGDKMMVVPVSTNGGLHPRKPSVLWEGHYSQGLSSSCGPPGVSSSNYDVSADGQRFLMIKDPDQDNFSTRIIIVVNWVEELRRLVEKK